MYNVNKEPLFRLIGILPISNRQDSDLTGSISYLINYPVITLPHTVGVNPVRKFLNPTWPRIIRKGIYFTNNLWKVFGGYCSKLFAGLLIKRY
jgi:hypothetical protein